MQNKKSEVLGIEHAPYAFGAVMIGLGMFIGFILGDWASSRRDSDFQLTRAVKQMRREKMTESQMHAQMRDAINGQTRELWCQAGHGEPLYPRHFPNRQPGSVV